MTTASSQNGATLAKATLQGDLGHSDLRGDAGNLPMGEDRPGSLCPLLACAARQGEQLS